MKVGDLVELSARSLRTKTGSWPDIRHTYKVGIVVEIEGPEMPLFTIEWNNGYQRKMWREEIKHFKGNR
jgi:hypothetical protein